MRTLLITLALLLAGRSGYGQSLYADPKARAEGDILTIVLNERTTAQRSSQFEDESEASLRSRADVQTPRFASRFAADARVGSEAFTMNETAQSEMLTGRMTATVVGRDQANNLIIEGERRLNVNGVTHIMEITGRVRPFDIDHNNAIASTQIADAHITYRKAGVARRFLAPGTLAKVGAVGAIVAAVILGL